MPIPQVVSRGQQDTDEVRRRALERLYLRKAAVDELIRSLQNYQEAQRAKAPCIPFSEVRKCS
jgi:predicted short-subunit dehydrogenase-like oxidoreductase (DUF2520 family)